MRPSWRNLSIGTKGLVVIAIPVLPLVVTAALYLQSEMASTRAEAETARSSRNGELAAGLLTEALRAESAVRGYLLNGDASLLDEQREARTAAASLMATLEANTVDPAQRDRLPRLRAALEARLDALDRVLETLRTSGLNSPEMLREVQRGAAATGELRTQLALLGRRNSDLLAERDARTAALRTRSRAIVAAGATGGVLGGVIAAVLFTTGVTRRLATVTRNVAHLSAGEPLTDIDPARDEIGSLSTGMQQASLLLAARDQQLQQRMRQLEHLSRELEAFSYSVSHDLRAPLRHVAGFASMLQRSAGAHLTDDQQRYVRTIIDAASHMGQLIDDLLTFSRTGRSELRRQPVDLGRIVAEVRQRLAAELDGRQIDWIVHPLPSVRGDAALLGVVFDNLLANAVKYTRPRPHAVIEVGHQMSDGDLVIFVRDNGVGFDMQYEQKLFGVFQRLHSSDQFEGTGIGLATVRRIIGRHGGRTWAEGRPDAGATFYVALPTEAAAA